MRFKSALLVLIVLFGSQVFANDTNERVYLTQILNQLNAIKPLVVAAAREEPSTNRYQFHYVSFTDANGKTHKGLLNDINEIEKGIIDKLDKMPKEARTFQPIQGDYTDHLHSGASS